MPTGYTHIIDKNPNVTFEEFVWGCARAFGALVMLRDDQDAPIPEEFKVGEYYESIVREAEEKLAEANALTNEDAAKLMVIEHEAAVARINEWREKESAALARYEAMREQVSAWTPPTEEHIRLREFMLEQLETGKPSFDWCKPPAKLEVSPERWRVNRIAECVTRLMWVHKSLKEERERVRSRNAWLKALRDSLSSAGQ